MGYESYLRKRRILVSSKRCKPTRKHLFACKVVDVFSFHYRFFTGLSLRLRANISKVTAHEDRKEKSFLGENIQKLFFDKTNR
jgi:hypothetical protein